MPRPQDTDHMLKQTVLMENGVHQFLMKMRQLRNSIEGNPSALLNLSQETNK